MESHHSRPEGVVEMFATSLRVLFVAVAIFAVVAVAFLLATA
jgi:nitrate reductase NapE component